MAKSIETPGLHTVLGASGAVGRAVISDLLQRGLSVRAVSRSLQLEGVENISADLLQPQDAIRATAGSSYVYLCVGLPYFASVWAKDWPRLMQNVIAACEQSQSVLVFLDNIYMYGPPPLAVPFDESHPQQPSSKKGQTRKLTADLLVQAMDQGRVQGLIGRAADFYGPYATNSLLYVSFLERMLKGKAPQSLAKPNMRHTYASVTDLGRALVALALQPDTYGQVWHLPVGEPVTTEELTSIMNEALGTDFKVSFLPDFLRTIVGWFYPPLREVNEMQYQFETEYIMSYEKFKLRFPDFQVTSYRDGISEMIAAFQEKES